MQADGSSMLSAAPRYDSLALTTPQQNGDGASMNLQLPRKRGRPPTKNRPSLPCAVVNQTPSNDSPNGNNNNINVNNSSSTSNIPVTALASPLFTPSNEVLMPSPARYYLEQNGGASSNNSAEKAKRVRHSDDQLLGVPFEFGWNRIVRFRWQPPSSQITAEVTYKSPSGRIFRSYAKINEFLNTEQSNSITQADNISAVAPVPPLRPEHFSFSSRARIAGTTFQKTVMNSQGFKEYREMSVEEVDLLFATMSEGSRNKLSNSTQIYQQIFGAFITSDGQMAIPDGGTASAVQDYSMKQSAQKTTGNCSADGRTVTSSTDAAVNLSLTANRTHKMLPGNVSTTTMDLSLSSSNNHYPPTSSSSDASKRISSSTLLPNNNVSSASQLAPLGSTLGALGSGAGSNDEQQAMLMFMTALFMQQQQQQQQQQSHAVSLFPPRTIAEPNSANFLPPIQGTKQLNNENVSLGTDSLKKSMYAVSSLGNEQLAADNLGKQMNLADPFGKSDQQRRTLFPPAAPCNSNTCSEVEKKKPQNPPVHSSSKPATSSIDREILRMQKLRQRQQERRLKIAELKQELNRQPADDMILIQRRQLPELPRFACYSLLASDSQAVADCLQTFEFVQTFANVLGLDVKGLPSLACLERGISAADRQSLLEVTDLLCRLVAIGLQDSAGWLEGAVHDLATALHGDNDPPHQNKHQHHHQHRSHLPSEPIDDDTELWQQLPKLPIDRTTVTEASRQFLIVRNNGRQTEETFVLGETVFQTLKPRHRARVLAAVCDELLAYSAVLGEIERSLAKSIELKRDLQTIQGQLKIVNQAASLSTKNHEKSEDLSPSKKQQSGDKGNINAHDAGLIGSGGLAGEEGDSGNDSDNNDNEVEQGIVPDDQTDNDVEKEDQIKAKADVKRLTRQEKSCRSRLVEATNRIRSIHIGFDRYCRSYWLLPHVGALLIHGSDFSEPLTTNNNDKTPSSNDEEQKVDNMKTADGHVDVQMEDGDDIASEIDNIDKATPAEAADVLPLAADGNESDSSNDDEVDDIEGVRWSPPPSYLASQQPSQQPQQPMQGSNINSASKNSPKLSRRKSATAGTRKSHTSQGVGANSCLSNAVPIDLSLATNQPSDPNSIHTLDAGGSSAGVTVTVDPAVLLQNFLLFAKSLNLTGMSSSTQIQPQQLLSGLTVENVSSTGSSAPVSSSSVSSVEPSLQLLEPSTEKVGKPSPYKTPVDNSNIEQDGGIRQHHHHHHNLKVHFEDEQQQPLDDKLINVPSAAADEHELVVLPDIVVNHDSGDPQRQATPPALEEKPEESSPLQQEDSPTTCANKELLHDKVQPIAEDLLRGWWRITDIETIHSLMRCLNPHGVRERHLMRNIQRNMSLLQSIIGNSSIDITTHGDLFKMEPSDDVSPLSKNAALALGAELESETFAEVVCVAKFVLSSNQILPQASQPYSGRGRPRKSQQPVASMSVTVIDMPPIDEYNEADDSEDCCVEENKENFKLQRAKRLLLNIAYSLVGKRMLQVPFAAVPVEINEEADTESTVYNFSEAFLRFIASVNKISTWSAVKLRLAQLETWSTVRLRPKDYSFQHASPKKQQMKTPEAPADIDTVASICRQLLEGLKEHVDSEPFLYPVSRVEYPSYFEIIEAPMDLQTIGHKLHQNCYRSVHDFAGDVRLIFNNCHQYNADGSEIYEHATRLKRWFERRLKQLTA